MAPQVSVILPCRDEEQTVGLCIEQIQRTFKKKNISGEIIVSDSSSDLSSYVAREYNVRLVKHNKKGYGIAIIEGIKRAKGDIIMIGDADGTYDFKEIPGFLKKIDKGYDLVIGSRLKGNIGRGAMPVHHKYIGNPLLSKTLNLFFKTHISDAHSGFRAIRKKALDKLELKTTGMEFASEMIIRAAKNKLKIGEIAISYYPRVGKSKLNSFSDGWRHLRFMLMFSPTYLFFIPGLLMFLPGIAILALLIFGTVYSNGVDIGTYISSLGALLAILGYQVISLGLYSRIYAIHSGFEKHDKMIDFIADKIPLERGVALGLFVFLLGLGGLAWFFINEGMINYPRILFFLTVLVIGAQTIFSVFFTSIMLIEKK